MSLDDDEDLKALRRAERRRAWTLRLIIWNFTAPMRFIAEEIPYE